MNYVIGPLGRGQGVAMVGERLKEVQLVQF